MKIQQNRPAGPKDYLESFELHAGSDEVFPSDDIEVPPTPENRCLGYEAWKNGEEGFNRPRTDEPIQSYAKQTHPQSDS